MTKLVKCSQCKYLKKSETAINEKRFSDMMSNRLSDNPGMEDAWNGLEEKIIYYGCAADESNVFIGSEITQNKECPLFRNRTFTAWQEVRHDIFHVISNLSKTIINFFIKNN